MKKHEVVVGRSYAIKVAGRMERITIAAESWSGSKHVGWEGTLHSNGHRVRVKDPTRLRPLATLQAASQGDGSAAPAEQGRGEQQRGKGGRQPAAVQPGRQRRGHSWQGQGFAQ